MQRPKTFFLGVAITVMAVLLRLMVGKVLFTSFGWGGPIEISPGYQDMRAWIDLFNIAIMSGIALAIVGWVVPER